MTTTKIYVPTKPLSACELRVVRFSQKLKYVAIKNDMCLLIVHSVGIVRSRIKRAVVFDSSTDRESQLIQGAVQKCFFKGLVP